MAELSKLLGFMSDWDRREVLAKYERLFDEAGDEAELIASLGSPTKLAIGLALNYVPSPPPAVKEEPEREGAESVEAPEAVEEAPDACPENADSGETPDAAEAPAEGAGEASLSPVPEEPPGEAAPKKRRVRPFGLILSVIFGLVIGLPVALVLICLGIPFILMGTGVVCLAVWAAVSVIGMLAMFSDVLVTVGAGLLICALGLLLLWFGLWLSFELGYIWISGAVLRLGRALSYKKEVAAE